MGNFCSNCGQPISENSKFCNKCGSPAIGMKGSASTPQYYHSPYQPTYVTSVLQENVVRKLSEKIKINAIIWLVIACIQYLLTAIYIINGFIAFNDYLEYESGMGVFYIIVACVLLFIAILNTRFSKGEFKYSNEIMYAPIGIVDKFTPIDSNVKTLIYNLFFGGVFGAIGAIYGFIVRSYVIKNEIKFIQIEQQFVAENEDDNDVQQPTEQTQPISEKIIQHTCPQCEHIFNVKYKASADQSKPLIFSVICPKCKSKGIIKIEK